MEFTNSFTFLLFRLQFLQYARFHVAVPFEIAVQASIDSAASSAAATAAGDRPSLFNILTDFRHTKGAGRDHLDHMLRSATQALLHFWFSDIVLFHRSLPQASIPSDAPRLVVPVSDFIILLLPTCKQIFHPKSWRISCNEKRLLRCIESSL